MKRYIYKIFGLILAITFMLPVLTYAAEDQFYFMARQTGAGSITQEGQQQKVVYLRWDNIEGKLPSDVIAIRLLRNNVSVTSDDFPANGVMSTSELNKLYSGTDQKRRRLEIVSKLNELAASKGDEFSASNFATYLHGLIDPSSPSTYDQLWSFLGSQTDFNIARARFRGWIDTTPSTGVVEYELLAVNASGETARLGLTRIEMGEETVLLGAKNLKQILSSTQRCDYPESAKDHFTVALNWDSPGEDQNETLTDQIASKFYLSGFDLYRSKVNVNEAQVLDIATLASQVSTDQRGNPQIDGLEKVNLSIIIDSGTVENEAKWLEARDLLKRYGLKPGDRRAYYLVARDFTGNYGPTIEELVEVPNITRPPAPWNISVFADQTSSAAELETFEDALLFSWDKVNQVNYMRMFQGTRKYCNATEAQQTGELEFVGIDQDCDIDLHRSVRLDVADNGYKVYRFTDLDVAGHFSDSDGDGVADSAERQLGTQCDSTKTPNGATNYLMTDSELLNISGEGASDKPDRVRLRDKVPAGNKDTVYWYRIASVVGAPEKQRLSFLSAPQRGLFPDRAPPPEPIVSVLSPSNGSCEIVSDASQPWSIQDTTRLNDIKGNRFALSCDETPYPEGLTISSLESPASSDCMNISQSPHCKQGSVLTLEKIDDPSCKVTVPQDISFCQQGEIEIRPNPDSVLVAANAGDEILTGVQITVKPPNAQSCVALYEYIDGSATRSASTCEPVGLTYNPGAGSFCGYAVATNENNNISAAVHFPCTYTPASTKALGAPQILSLDVNETEATFTFRMPAEQAAVTMIQLDHDKNNGENDRKVTSIPAINFSSGEIVSHAIPVNALLNTKDSFCLALKAISRNSSDESLNSSWSKQRCYTRTLNGEVDKPSFLPWPTVKSVAAERALYGGITQALQEDIIFLLLSSSTFDGHCRSLESSGLFSEIICSNQGRLTIENTIKPNINYLLYRQKRVGNVLGDWVQVSPLIEFMHFDEISSPTLFSETPKPELLKWRLNDPFLKVHIDQNQFYVVHQDRYPFVTNRINGQEVSIGLDPYEFRYQAVYFDKDHRPSRWRQSNWIKVVK